MTLLEYITSLQDQGLSQEEIFAEAQRWKKENQPKETEVVETTKVVEEGKPPAVVETDTTVTAETNEVSDPSDSGDGESQLSPYNLAQLDLINQRAERAIAMDAAVDVRKSRRSLEEAAGFVADFKSSSNVINEVGIFKDKDGNVIDTSNIEIEEEKIPAPFTQARKDYYDEKGFAYDNTIVPDEQELPYDFNKKLKQAVSEYKAANNTDRIFLSDDEAKKAGLTAIDETQLFYAGGS